MNKSAILSECRTYRYALSRVWDADLPPLVVIGLNPSTADEVEDDRTIRRCIGFAQRENLGGLLMLNLFAYRSTDPKALRKVADPIGYANDEVLRSYCQGRTVLAAWGNPGSYLGRDKQVLEMLKDQRVVCFGLTKAGHPLHPLYQKREAPFIDMARLIEGGAY